MKDSDIEWLGDIPINWYIHSLKRVLSTSITDGPHETPILYDEGIPFVSAESVKGGIINLDYKRGYISLEDHGRFQRKVSPKKGDIFIVKSGATTGNVGLVITDQVFDIWSPLALVRGESSTVEQEFLYYQLLSNIFRVQVEQGWSYGTQQNISMKALGNIKVIVPPLEEQKTIIKYLHNKCAQIDTIIAKEQSVIEKLQEYKQSVITETVTKGLDPKVDIIESDISWIKTIPVTWKVSKLKYVADFSPKCDFTDIEPDTEVTYTPMEYIKKGNYIPNSEHIGKLSASLTKYEEGDIVIAKVTPCFENGNMAIMNNLKSGKGLGSSELFVFRVPETIRKFVFYWMQNKLFIEQCVATMTGTGGLKRVSSYYISNSEVFLPPLEMIDDICNYLDEKCELIERTIRQKELVINQLNEYKKSLIYEVVTGKKEVPHV